MQTDLVTSLHYRRFRLRGDMIMAFKIVTGVMDRPSMVSCNFTVSHFVARGNRYKIIQTHVHY